MKFLESKQKNIIFDKDDDENIIFSWIFEETFSKSYQGLSENQIVFEKIDYPDNTVFLLSPAQNNFPLFDLIVIDKLNHMVYFVSIKVIKPKNIKGKNDLKFLLKPLKKIPEGKTIEDVKNSIIEKFKNYCETTKKTFGIYFKCLFI